MQSLLGGDTRILSRFESPKTRAGVSNPQRTIRAAVETSNGDGFALDALRLVSHHFIADTKQTTFERAGPDVPNGVFGQRPEISCSGGKINVFEFSQPESLQAG